MSLIILWRRGSTTFGMQDRQTSLLWLPLVSTLCFPFHSLLGLARYVGRTRHGKLVHLLKVCLQTGDPEVGLGDYSQGVRVGPGTRMPRLPALFRPKRKWRLARQQDPLDYFEQSVDPGSVWRRNYASLATFEEQVLEVMHDQASRGQLLVYSEAEAHGGYTRTWWSHH